jgi:hypothetical protein
MVSRRILRVRPLTFTISGFATANPARTSLESNPTLNPCARNVFWEHPCGAPASSWSARFSSVSRQTFRGFTAIAHRVRLSAAAAPASAAARRAPMIHGYGSMVTLR